jgi:tetratricopeptide (TPR) repeat protein
MHPRQSAHATQALRSAQAQETPPTPVKGSWEDLLSRAQQFASNYNDEAIPLYEKVLDGIVGMPAAQRNANERRLYMRMMAAAIGLLLYFNRSDRYDDALAVIDKVHEAVDAPDRKMLDLMRRRILAQAGRTDEAIALYRAVAEAPGSDLDDWESLLMTYVRAGRAAEALPVLDDMEASLGQVDHAQDVNAQIAALRSYVALEAGDFDAGIRYMDQLFASAPDEAGRTHDRLYGLLMRQGRYEDLLHLLNQDVGGPASTKFWRGLVYFHQGDTNRARRQWQEASAVAPQKLGPYNVLDQVLARYYLGDPEGEGLGIILGGLRETQTEHPLFYLYAGLGWAIRGDLRAAKTDLRVALDMGKSYGEGAKLPKHYWLFAQDLIPPEQLDDFRAFFEGAEDTPTPA